MKPPFPITLRVIRLIYLLLRSFSSQLEDESEGFLNTLIRLASGGEESNESKDGQTQGKERTRTNTSDGGVPNWLRVLSMEILRGLCLDGHLLYDVYVKYDSSPTHSKVFYNLVFMLSRVIAEKPALLGVSHQMRGLGIPGQLDTGYQSGAGQYVDYGLNAVASAASVGVNAVGAMMIAEQAAPGLGADSGVRVQW